MKRVIDRLWRDCLGDEKRLISIYRKIAKELEELELYDASKAFKVMVQSEETHMDIINDIIFSLKQRIQVEEIKKK